MTNRHGLTCGVLDNAFSLSVLFPQFETGCKIDSADEK